VSKKKAEALVPNAAPPPIPGMGQIGDVAATWVSIDFVKRWDRNPRINAATVPFVVESIKRFGFGAPLVCRPSGVLIAGDTRIQAAHQLGLKAVPVRVMDHLGDSEADALALADNKAAEASLWNPGMLAEVLRGLDSSVAQCAGWSSAELDKILAVGAVGAAGGANEAETDSPAEELQKKWRTELGQLWQCGRHRLLIGDSRLSEAASKTMGGAQARWMWTDPPYGVSYVGKTKDALEIENDGSKDLPALLARAFGAADAMLAMGSPIYVAHPAGAQSVKFHEAFIAIGWHLHQTVIWVKDAMVLGHSDYHFRHEPIIYGWKGKNRSWFGGRNKTSVLEYARPKRSDMHPTMKPVQLVVDCLKNSAPAGSIGYEPFAGSGTTMVAAEQCDLSCNAIELDPKFAAVTLERLSLLGVKPIIA
jgi:DNA modification methylase